MHNTSLTTRLLEMAVKLQQIPAPTFSEDLRAAFVQAQFLAEGLSDVALDEAGNVLGRFPGTGMAPPIIVSAHLDTVFPASTDLSVAYHADQIAGPGIGDNALGLAGLFGLLWKLHGEPGGSSSVAPLPGDLWLIANVGEEGLGDLRGMRAVVDRFREQPLAYIVLEGMALGQVYHRGLGVQRYRLTAHTAGGHSWVDFGQPSAIHELAGMIARLVTLPLPDEPRASLNVGVIAGGISVNTIAPEAHLELDLRSEDGGSLAELTRQVETMVRAANRPGVRFTAEVIGQRPAGGISALHPLVHLAVHCLEAAGLQANLNIGSTDANIPLSRGLPAICIGLSTGCGAHTGREYIHTQPVAQGLDALVNLITRAYQEL
jgi:tripeptide aminopeptidase